MWPRRRRPRQRGNNQSKRASQEEEQLKSFLFHLFKLHFSPFTAPSAITLHGPDTPQSTHYKPARWWCSRGAKTQLRGLVGFKMESSFVSPRLLCVWTPHSLAIKLIGGVAAYKEDCCGERQGRRECGSNGLNGPLCVMRLMEANTEPLVVRFLANGNLYLLSEWAPQCNFIVVVDLSIPVCLSGQRCLGFALFAYSKQFIQPSSR